MPSVAGCPALSSAWDQAGPEAWLTAPLPCPAPQRRERSGEWTASGQQGGKNRTQSFPGVGSGHPKMQAGACGARKGCTATSRHPAVCAPPGGARPPPFSWHCPCPQVQANAQALGTSLRTNPGDLPTVQWVCGRARVGTHCACARADPLQAAVCQSLSLCCWPPHRGPDEDGGEEAAPGPRQAHDSLYRVHMPSLYSCGSSYGSETSIPAAAHTVSNAPVTEYM